MPSSSAKRKEWFRAHPWRGASLLGSLVGVARFVLETVDDYYESSSPLLAGVIWAVIGTVVIRLAIFWAERAERRRSSKP